MTPNTDEVFRAPETEAVACGVSLGLAGKVAGRCIHTITHIILGRCLGPAHYGLYAIGLTVFRIGTLAGTFGFDRGFLEFGSMDVSQCSTSPNGY